LQTHGTVVELLFSKTPSKEDNDEGNDDEECANDVAGGWVAGDFGSPRRVGARPK
jgi:hypothetical protein